MCLCSIYVVSYYENQNNLKRHRTLACIMRSRKFEMHTNLFWQRVGKNALNEVLVYTNVQKQKKMTCQVRIHNKFAANEEMDGAR